MGVLRRSVVSGGSIAYRRANFSTVYLIGQNIVTRHRIHSVGTLYLTLYRQEACPYNPHKGWLSLEPHRRDDPSGPQGQGTFQPPGTLSRGVTLSSTSGTGNRSQAAVPLATFRAVSSIIRRNPAAVG